MSKQIEAIKLALEVLKNCRENLFLKDYVEHIDLTITALREALAEQPVQIESLADIGAAYEGIYAEQKAELAKALAEQPAQQEPVAWMNPHGGMLTANYIENFASGLDKEIHNIPLYTSPQPAPEPDQQAAAVMPCGAVVSNVYEAYEAGKKAQQEQTQEAACKAAAAEGNRLGVKSTDALRIVAAYVNATTPQAQPAQQEPVAEVKAKMTGGNVGIATVIHEIHSPLREPLQPGDKLYPAYRWIGWDVEQVWSERIFGVDMRFENVQDAIAFRKKLEEATTPQAQPAREPLTDEQILEIKAQFVWTLDFQFGEFARAIEAAHGITKGGAA